MGNQELPQTNIPVRNSLSFFTRNPIKMKRDLQEALGKQTEFIQPPDGVYLPGKFEKRRRFL